MIYQPIEKLLPRAGNSSYKLITMAFQRAKELACGSPKLVEGPSNEKATTTAFREIIAGKVELKEVADDREKKTKKQK